MHQPPDMSAWHGRVDTEEQGISLRWHQVVKPWRDDAGTTVGNVLLGFGCDAGIARNHGRRGAASGPEVIRAALANLAWHGNQSVFDAGDVSCVHDELEDAQHRLGHTVAKILQRDHRPVLLGGGHEIAWGSWQGLASFAETQTVVPRLGIVNFDAHFDLRHAAQANSGTPFRQIAEDCARRQWPFHYACLGVSQTSNTQALFERAKELNVWWELDTAMRQEQLPQRVRELQSFAHSVDWIYLTIDLDVFPAHIAPGVSAPAACGVDFVVIETLVETLLDTGKVRLIEVAELNPRFDQDLRSARVAARLIARCCHR